MKVYQPEGFEIINAELARLRGWLEFLRDNDTPYPQAIARMALDTSHWPDEAVLCQCGYPMRKGDNLCVNCRAEEQDYKDEIEERGTLSRGY